MTTRRSKNFEFLENNIYPYFQIDEDEEQVIYLKFDKPSQKLEQDKQVKLPVLKLIDEDKEFLIYEVSKEFLEIKVSDIVKSIVESTQAEKSIEGKLKQVYQIEIQEDLRFIKLFEQKQEAQLKAKGIDLVKKKQEELERQRELKREEEEKNKVDPDAEKEAKNPNFKKGKHNLNIKSLTESPEQESADKPAFFTRCCIDCNNKELYRAAITGNKKLLETILESEKQISTLFARWGTDRDYNCIEAIFANNDLEMLKIVIDFLINKAPKFKYSDNQTCNVNNANTHHNSKYSGQYILGLQNQNYQNKEGNQALVHDKYYEQHFSNYMIQRLFTFDCDSELFDQLRMLTQYNLEDIINNNIGLAVKCGNRNLAAKLINFMSTKRSGWGYNQLHEETLTKDSAKEIYDFKTQSIMKQPLSEKKITPLHCACINPNPDIIERILNQQDQSQYKDEQGLGLVHYAAACSGPGPLEYLVAKKKLSPTEREYNQGNTPLQIAAMYGRSKNVEFLLSDKTYYQFDYCNHQQNTALHLACCSGDFNTVKAFINKKCPVEFQCGNLVQPLHYAAANGNFEIVELLIKNKANINIQDRSGKTPLIYAIKNNNVKVVSYLLKNGADYDLQDNSNNFPVHYACAYGFYECVQLLYTAGCELNYYNAYNITPLCIALLKGHNRIVEQLLDFDTIDIDCTDDQGQTLIYLEVSQFFQKTQPIEERFTRINFLLEQGANPNLQNKLGETPLHFVCGNHISNVEFLALKDEEWPEKSNKTHPFYKKLREQLKLKEEQETPDHLNEYKIFYEEAKNSKEVQEDIELIKKEYKDEEIFIQTESEIVIENYRLKLVSDKKNQIIQKYQDQTVTKLIKLLLQYNADPTIISKNYISPIYSALSLQGDFYQFKTILNEAIDLDISAGFPKAGIYHEIVEFITRIDLQDNINQLINLIISIDKNKQENLNQIDDSGFSFLQKYIQNYHLLPKNTQNIALLGVDINQKSYKYRQQIKTFKQQKEQLQNYLKQIEYLIENGADPHFRVQRILKFRKTKGKNRELKDENYDMQAELDEEEAKQKKLEEDAMDEEGNIDYSKMPKVKQQAPITNQYTHLGEQNFYSIVIQSKQEYIQELFPILLKNKVNILNRDVYNRTPFHYYLKTARILELKDLDFFFENMKYPHLFRYQEEGSGDTYIHTFLQRCPQYQLPQELQVLQENQTVEQQQKKIAEYQQTLIEKLFYIKGMSKLFKLSNNYEQTPLMILLNSSQVIDRKNDPYFQELLKIKEVIDSITQIQDNNWTCLHSLFKHKINNIENLETLLKAGGHALLTNQTSFIVSKGRGKKKQQIETENLQTPLHVLISTGNIRKNVLDCILQYQEGRDSLKIKDIQHKNPLFYLVERGYGAGLIKQLIVKEQINDLSKSNSNEDNHSVLNKFITVFHENDATCQALDVLLQHGASIDFVEKRDKDDKSLIVKLVQSNKYKFAKILFQHGQEINFNFKFYQQKLTEPKKEDFYVISKHVSDSVNPLFKAIQNQDNTIIKDILELKNLDPNFTDLQKRNALHYALNSTSNQQIIKNLIDRGTNMNLDFKDRTPFHYAFIKYSGENDRNHQQQCDPFENISILCSYEKYDKYISQQDIHGKSLLHYAAVTNSAMCLRYLLKKKLQFLNINQKDNYGNTPLSLAFLNRNSDFVQILIEAKADLTVKAYSHRDDILSQKNKPAPQKQFNEEDWSDMEDEEDLEKKQKELQKRQKLKEEDKLFFEFNLFDLAIQFNWQGVCSLLIEYGYDLQEACETAFSQKFFNMARSLLFKAKDSEIKLNKKGQNLLHSFANYGIHCEKNITKKIYQELLKKKLDVQLQDAEGNTPLFYAAQSGFLYLVKHLIMDQKANVNTQNKQGQTANHIAFINNFNTIVQKIFDLSFEEINFKLQDNKGKTVLHYLPKNYVQKTAQNLKLVKRFNESKQQNITNLSEQQKQFCKILEKYDQNLLNIQDKKGKSVLHYAIKYQNLYMIKLLVEANINLNIQSTSRKQQTAVHMAVQLPLQTDIFFFLIRSIQGKNINFTLQNFEGNNILHLAAQHQQYSIFEKLPKDFDINVQNKKQETALSIAIRNKHQQFYTKLFKLNANVNTEDIEGNTPLHYACINNDFYAIDLLISSQAKLQTLNKKSQSQISVCISHKNFLAATKLIFESKIDLSKEYVTSFSQERFENLKKQVINEEQKKQLQNNYGGQQLIQQRQFIYDIVTKKEKVEGKKRDVYYVVTALVTPLLTSVAFSKLNVNNSLLQKQKPKEETKQSLENKETLKKQQDDNVPEVEQLYISVDQSEYQPQINSPERQTLIKELLERGQNPYQQDKNGEYLFNKSIMKNDVYLLNVLLKYIKDIKIFQQEKTGRNPIHICVEPLEYGSYQNTEILKTLIQHKFDINQEDKEGNTPLDLAFLQDHNKMIDILEKEGGLRKKKMLNIKRNPTSIIANVEWPAENVDIEKESDKYIQYINSKFKIQDVDEREPYPQASQNLGFGFYNKLELCSDRNGYYDALLTSIDIKQGQFGTQVYYKLQLLYSTSSRVYTVFVNQGRIGTDGSSTSTAFQKKAEAVKEFTKLFEEKTGNTWNKRSEFQKKQGLYNFHQPVERLDYQSRIQAFDFRTIENGGYKQEPVKYKETDKNIANILKQILNLEAIKRQFQQLNLEQDLFNIDLDIVEEAHQILQELRQLSIELQEETQNLVNADAQKIFELKDKIGDKSNEYYSLIPETGYSNKPMQFLDKGVLIQKKEYILNTLKHLDSTAILICAAHSQLHYQKVHPVDFMRKALQVKLQRLEENHVESKLIMRYINNTSNTKIANIFALERKGEAERIQQFKHLNNRLVLFYPCNEIDMLSTLQNGVRGTIPGSNKQKSFGPGIYLTDSFQYAEGFLENNYWHNQLIDENLEQQKIAEQTLKQQKKQKAKFQDQEESNSDDDDDEDESDIQSSSDDDDYSIQDKSQQEKEDYLNSRKKYKYVFLLETALGNTFNQRKYKEIDQLPLNYNSIKGEGKKQPLDQHNIVIANGAVFPSGKLQDLEEEDERKYAQLTAEQQKKYEKLQFDYNQYVVHNESQVRIRYMIQIDDTSIHNKILQ